MKDLAWGEILSVDVDEIDEDHRKLLDIFNLLNHALEDAEPAEYVAALLEELINCTIWHFSHEERLMLRHGYAEIDQHRAMHQELIRGARELQQNLRQAGKSVAEEDLVFLERWLTEHILTDDRRLGDYLSQVM